MYLLEYSLSQCRLSTLYSVPVAYIVSRRLTTKLRACTLCSRGDWETYSVGCVLGKEVVGDEACVHAGIQSYPSIECCMDGCEMESLTKDENIRFMLLWSLLEFGPGNVLWSAQFQQLRNSRHIHRITKTGDSAAE